MSKVISSLREFRLARRLSQAELARQVGISRQALCAAEAGTAVPGTDLALRLSAALGTRVEVLFQLADAPPRVQARAAGERPLHEGERVVLGEVDGRWVAHLIDRRRGESLAADGLVHAAAARGDLSVEPLGDLGPARQRLVVMGCAPALGILASRLGGEAHGCRLAWVQGSSTAALLALKRGEVHVAGVHLLDERSGRYNSEQVRRAFPGERMLRVVLASWEQGIVVAPGNPKRLRRASDLARPRVRLVAREPGAGAHKLLERALRAEGIDRVPAAAKEAHGHLEVAQAIALGAADAGVAIRSAALAFGLDFVPLAEERFDLVIPPGLATDPRVERMVDVLGSRSFRRELDLLGGYGTGQSGQVEQD